MIERAIILSDRHEIQVKDLPPDVREPKDETVPEEETPVVDVPFKPGVLEIDAGDRMPDSGFKVRQMRAIEFIKAHGFITNKYYSQLAEISERQALRELSELVDSGKLNRTGKGRACRYILSGSAQA